MTSSTALKFPVAPGSLELADCEETICTLPDLKFAVFHSIFFRFLSFYYKIENHVPNATTYVLQNYFAYTFVNFVTLLWPCERVRHGV